MHWMKKVMWGGCGVDVGIQAHRHTCTQACMHTYIHTYLPTYLHTYIHTYIHTNPFIYFFFSTCLPALLATMLILSALLTANIKNIHIHTTWWRIFRMRRIWQDKGIHNRFVCTLGIWVYIYIYLSHNSVEYSICWFSKTFSIQILRHFSVIYI